MSSCTVRRSTPFITRRLANVCRRSCQWRFSIPASRSAGTKTRLMKFLGSSGVLPVLLGKGHRRVRGTRSQTTVAQPEHWLVHVEAVDSHDDLDTVFPLRAVEGTRPPDRPC